ncbi:MAG: alpha/beta hydrolase [Actinobacteria bacterium]|nr:MAG: alpha/beta hydrolase [Actinomycetota bacterium]
MEHVHDTRDPVRHDGAVNPDAVAGAPEAAGAGASGDDLDASGVPRHDVPAGGRSGFTLVQGRQVHYLQWGRSSAPPVLCLHGGGQTAYMYEELGGALAPSHHVLAPDLPSHGDSDSLAGMARTDIAATLPPLLGHFGLERVAVVGASLGGIVAITLAAAQPGLVAGIVLIDVGHRLEEEGVLRIIDFMSRQDSFASLDEAAAAIAAYLPHRKEIRASSLTRNLRQRPDGRWQWKHSYGRRLREQGDETAGDWRGVLAGLGEDAAGLRCPVLVLRGSASDVLSDEGAEEVAALIPDARLATVVNAGHLAAGDNPESTVGLVVSFLAELGW